MEEKKGFAVFEAITMLVLLVPVSAVLNGFVLMKIWNWFMPYIEVSKISIPVAIGLSSLVWLFRDMTLQKKKMSTKESIMSIFVPPLFMLGFSYIITLFL